MKKRNFKWLINITALALCFGALAIGVYAAKTASLTANGTIGFQAHSCTVNVGVSGSGWNAEGTAAQDAKLEAQDVSGTVTNKSITPVLYFSDLQETGGDTITLTFSMVNKSAYAVDAKFTISGLPNTVTAKLGGSSTAGTTGTTKLAQSTSTVTYSIVLTLADIQNAAKIDATEYSILVVFTRAS